MTLPMIPPNSTLKLLLVEDNSINQEIFIEMMEVLNYPIDIADNGLQAIELVKSNQYAIVFMDIQMPGLSGVETTTAIRAWESQKTQWTPLTIIALTAGNTSDDVKSYFAAGMNDCVAKPFDMRKIKNILLEWNIPPAQINVNKESELSLLTNALSTVLLDVQALKSMREYSSESFVCDITKKYLSDAPHLFELLQIAIDNSDSKQCVYHAHTLRGMSLAVGAKRVGLLCENIERLGKERPLSEIQKLLESSYIEFKLVRQELLNLLKSAA